MRLVDPQRKRCKACQILGAQAFGQMQQEPLAQRPVPHTQKQKPCLQHCRPREGAAAPVSGVQRRQKCGVKRLAQAFGRKLAVIGGLVAGCGLKGGLRLGRAFSSIQRAALPIFRAADGNRRGHGLFEMLEMAQGGVCIAQTAQSDEPGEEFEIRVIGPAAQLMAGCDAIGGLGIAFAQHLPRQLRAALGPGLGLPQQIEVLGLVEHQGRGFGPQILGNAPIRTGMGQQRMACQRLRHGPHQRIHPLGPVQQGQTRAGQRLPVGRRLRQQAAGLGILPRPEHGGQPLGRQPGQAGVERKERRLIRACHRKVDPGAAGFGLGLGHATAGLQRADHRQRPGAGFGQVAAEPPEHPRRGGRSRHRRFRLFPQQRQARPIGATGKEGFILGQRAFACAQALPFDDIGPHGRRLRGKARGLGPVGAARFGQGQAQGAHGIGFGGRRGG